MKRGYKNPLVTYEELVEAIKAIIECSLNNNYMDDFDYLNLKYESESSEQYEGAEERALYKAVKSLEKTIDSANKIIKDNLEQNLRELELSRFTIHVNYLIGHERRKLAASPTLIEKLAKASINLNTIFNASYEEEKNDVLEPIQASNKDKAEDFVFETDESDEDVEFEPIKKKVDSNKEFSTFEKKAILNFPEFFKEELEMARKYNEEYDDEPLIELNSLFNTMELEPIVMDYIDCENISEDNEDDSDIILKDDIVDSKEDDLALDFIMPKVEKTKKEEVIEDSKKEKIIEKPKKDDFVEKLKQIGSQEIRIGRPKEIKSETSKEIKTETVKEEQPKEQPKKTINKEKVLLIKKALDKAKSMQDKKLIDTLKKQLAKELGVGK